MAFVPPKGASEMITLKMDGVSGRSSVGVHAKLKGVFGSLRHQEGRQFTRLLLKKRPGAY